MNCHDSIRSETNAREERTHNSSGVNMQMTPPLSSLSPVLPLSEFLPAFFRALDAENVRFCVLRNYEGFPAINLGSDVDLLIQPDALPRALRAIRSIHGVRIVSSMRRSYVASVFVEGIASTGESRSLQLDFLWSLSWKEMPYVPAGDVLRLAARHAAGNVSFLVPMPVHEAIISLLASLLYGGWAKEKYLPQVRQLFAAHKADVIAALSPQFGPGPSARLVSSVIGGDREEIHRRVRPLRVALSLRSLPRRPMRTLQGIAEYYAREIAVRFSPGNIFTVCIVGPDEFINTEVIEKLMPMLHSTAKSVERHHVLPHFPCARESSNSFVSKAAHARIPGGYLASMARIVLWLLKEWTSQFIGKKHFTLRISDNCYHDLLINPERYAYSGPIWFARLFGRITPSPGLWVLLDPDAETLQTKSQDAPLAETVRKIECCRDFVNATRKFIILDAGRPAASVAEGAYAAIINALAQHSDEKLRPCVDSPSKKERKLKVVILGPDGAGKSSVIQGLMSRLCQEKCAVKVRHLKPRIVLAQRGEPGAINVDPHSKPPRSAITSIAKIVIWLMEEWYAHLFQDRPGTLLICDRYYHDLLVDSIRYRYGGPQWMARLAGKLMPQPQLWVLLDAPAEVLQARKQEVSPAESARQRQAYLAFIRKQRQYAIVDASQSLDRVIADVEQAITGMGGAEMLLEKLG